jgi:NADPH-dependent 7-cyano-7-deazaguanine reductase QueF
MPKPALLENFPNPYAERAVNRILDDLVAKVQPRRRSVAGDVDVRGGLESVITAHWPPPAQ